MGESTGSLTAEREKITGELSEKQLQRLADEKDVGLHEAALEGLRSRTGEADARARELQTAIEAAKAKIEANALKIAEMERVRGDNQQKIAAAEETIRSANAARLEKEAAISKLGQDNRALTDERERMSGEMARLAERPHTLQTIRYPDDRLYAGRPGLLRQRLSRTYDPPHRHIPQKARKNAADDTMDH